eukprot:403348111
MFTHSKKDYYSVNADISLSPVKSQMLQSQQPMMLDEDINQSQMMGNVNATYGQTAPNGAMGMNTGPATSNATMYNTAQPQFQDNSVMSRGSQNPHSSMGNTMVLMNQAPTRYDDVFYPRTDKRMIKGNQYAYEGNEFAKQTYQAQSVEDSIEQIIQNQEQGRSSMEFFNPLSRAKLSEMKNIQVPKQVKTYSGLYQDSVVSSTFHEKQRFGHIGDRKQEWRNHMNDHQNIQDYISPSNRQEEESPVQDQSNKKKKKSTMKIDKDQSGPESDTSSSDEENDKMEKRDEMVMDSGNESDINLKPSQLKQKTNFNVISLDCQPDLKKFIKNVIVSENYENDEEICKRLHHGLLVRNDKTSNLQMHFYDQIGHSYSTNPFNMKQHSKFKSKSDKMATDQNKRRQTIKFKALTGGIALLPEEYTNMSENDDRNGGEFFFNTLSIKNKSGILEGDAIYIKAKTASKLYFMNQRQIEKAILMSLVKLRGPQTQFRIEELWLQDIVESFNFPTYRKVFTNIQTPSIVILNDNVAQKHMLNIEMPHFIFKPDNQEETSRQFKKYIDPDNYNVMLQSRLQDWKDNAVDTFTEMVGDDIENPVAPHINSKNTVIFERNNKDSQGAVFKIVKNPSDCTTMSTMVFPNKNFKSSEDGVFMRIDGYALILANSVNGENLISHSFNLNGNFEKLLNAQKENYDILKVFAHSVKTFANAAADVWRIYQDLDESLSKHQGQQWKLAPGEDQKIKIPLHIDNHRLKVILQFPKLYYASARTNFNEVLYDLSIPEMEDLNRQKFANWETYCYDLHSRDIENYLTQQKEIMDSQN